MSATTLYKSDRLTRSGAEYLAASLDRQKSLKSWKRLEKKRVVAGVLIPIFLILGILSAVILLICFPYRAEDSIYSGAIYAAAAFLFGVIAALIPAFVRSGINRACEKAFVACYLAEVRAEEATDAVKSETLDPVLGNALLIGACARMTICDGKRIKDQSSAFSLDGNKNRVLRSAVNSAVVHIDGIEAGALDLSNEFSVFRLPTGQHTVKLKLKKDFPRFEKCIELETPVTTVRIADDYRILLYTIDTRLENGRLTYALRLSEYDDVTTFRRDLLGTDRLERLEREADLSDRLVERSRYLYRTLRTRKQYADIFVELESKRYRREKHRWVHRRAASLPVDVIREYQEKAKLLYQKILDTTDEAKKKSLNNDLDRLVRELYDRLEISDTASLVSLQEEHLKNVLLWGQENMRYENIAAQLLIEREEGSDVR